MNLYIYLQNIKKNPHIPLGLMGLFLLYLLIQMIVLIGYFKLRQSPIVLPKMALSPPPLIAQWHLWGTYELDYDNLPETRLQLTLQGTLINPHSSHLSLAMIASPNQNTKTYYLNDTLPGGASIRAIELRRVIIDDNGQLERLMMPLPKLGLSKSAAN